MDKAAREKARELCEKATAGPWGIGRAPRGRVFVDGPSTNPSIPSPDVVCSPDLSDRFVEQDNDNMRFIAAARTLLPQALDSLTAADSDNARLRARVSELEAALEATEHVQIRETSRKMDAILADQNRRRK